MSELLTTIQLQDLLQVDRTTIYRMIQSGQLAGIRVGKQWRFDRAQVLSHFNVPGEFLAGTGGTALPPDSAVAGYRTPAAELRDFLSQTAVQMMQDAYAELLGVMIVTTDMEGVPITRISNPCGYFAALADVPGVIAHCVATWRRLGGIPSLAPRLETSELGLLCTRGFIRRGDHLVAMVIAGCVAPEGWPPAPDALERIAWEIGADPKRLACHVQEVFDLEPAKLARLPRFAQTIADIFAQVVCDRERLQKIEAIAAL